MNRRDQELLVDKHNEALKVMPVSFLNQGYEVTVCDPSYANYKFIPDLSIYDEYPQINTYITLRPNEEDLEHQQKIAEHCMNRNFFCYSLFKIAPVIAQPNLYADGLYNDMNAMYPFGGKGRTQVAEGTTVSRGFRMSFMQAYEALKKYPEMTKVSDSDQNTFLLIVNDATHEPMLLQEPAYEPAAEVDNTAYDAAHTDRFHLNGQQLHMDNLDQVTHYQANMAGMIQLGRWMDYLRQQGVYDNTKIIIVADHGHKVRQLEDRIYAEGTEFDLDTMNFNPLLLVKDFGSQEFTTDETFMTLGDVPSLAFSGIIENPVNPFTGKPITMEPKQGEQHVMVCSEWNVLINNGTTFLPSPWYSVHDDVRDVSNWMHIEDPSLKN